MTNNLKYSHTPFGAEKSAPNQHLNTNRIHYIDANACFVVMQEHLNLVRKIHTDNYELCHFSLKQLNELGIEVSQSDCFYLGYYQHKHWWLYNLQDQLTIRTASNTDFEFADLRQIGRHIDDINASIASYARGLKHWNENSQYCGRCGSTTHITAQGRSRCCDNNNCQYQQFPRIDPAVIVLVTHQFNGVEYCLLGHNQRFTKGFYSALAGYVDLGETLEQAVVREIKEESNIDVYDVRYVTSQPWPFPQSLMMGFFAKAKNTDIVLNDNELNDAQWFNADQLKEFGEMGHIEKNYMLPSETSIAYYLIQTWLKKQQNIN